MTTAPRSPSPRRAWAALLVLALLAVCAAALLPPDGDGLPFFDDSDTDSDGLSLVVRIAHAALPAVGGELVPSRIAVSLVAKIEVSLPDSVPSRLLPSRSPPRA